MTIRLGGVGSTMTKAIATSKNVASVIEIDIVVMSLTIHDATRRTERASMLARPSFPPVSLFIVERPCEES